MQVKCSNSDAIIKGSSEVTCKTGTDFTFSEEPSCSVLGKYHNEDLSIGTIRFHKLFDKPSLQVGYQILSGRIRNN